VPTLVRGLDYYTRTTFEFVDEAIGAQSSICGGGRYDGLIQEIGGPPTPGIGFGAGIERLLLSMEAAGVAAEQPGLDVFVALLEADHKSRVLPLIAELRRGAAHGGGLRGPPPGPAPTAARRGAVVEGAGR
jgi:histidyl-tRNA synthetase